MNAATCIYTHGAARASRGSRASCGAHRDDTRRHGRRHTRMRAPHERRPLQRTV